MIRIYEYNNPTNFKDFENFVFTSLSNQFFDIPNDKVTLRGVDYRISTIIILDDDTVVSGNIPPSYTGNAEIEVGGINNGDSFISANMQEMWDSLIKQEKFPTLVAPSSTFNLIQQGLQEIGITITLNFETTFNRGEISPAYGTSGFRSGLPNSYNYTGIGLSDFASTLLTDNKEVADYEVVANIQSWTNRVAYTIGEQPKSSYDNDFDSPLPAGETNLITRSIIGVYPFFATTNNITTKTKQALQYHNAIYFQVEMVAEDDAGNKQIIDFSNLHSEITGIQFFNTVSGNWEWLNGSKSNSLALFDISNVTHVIQSNTINYKRYTHNGVKTGARQLRFYTN